MQEWAAWVHPSTKRKAGMGRTDPMALPDPPDQGPDFLCIVPLDKRINRGLHPHGPTSGHHNPYTEACCTQTRMRGSSSVASIADVSNEIAEIMIAIKPKLSSKTSPQI